MFGGGADQLTSVLAYVKAHGGGTIAVSSQSTAASSIIASGAKVAGIGGFSGSESEVNAKWLAQEVQNGNIRWVVGDSTGTAAGGRGGFGGGGGGGASGGRVGATKVLATVANVCTRVTVSSTTGTSTSTGTTLYDCVGKAAALRAATS